MRLTISSPAARPTGTARRIVTRLLPLLLVSGLLVGLPSLAQAAPATSQCYNVTKYTGYITSNYANRGIVGDINYAQSDMQLYDDNTDHALLYIDNASQPDPSVPQTYGFGWLQGGFGVGKLDNMQTDTTEVYGESLDLNDSAPDAHFYPDLAWGNRYFQNYWTGETGYNGRGLYVAGYSDSDTWLAQSYLIDPAGTEQFGGAEARLNDPNGTCPEIVAGYFGTTGSADSWDSSTELYIDNNQPMLVPWTPANIETQPYVDTHYSLTTYNSDDAFDSYGGP
jgi:hypothetical protein